jgi:hypothetical protein
MYRGDMPVRAMNGRGPMGSWCHELLDYVCAAAYRRTFLGRVHAYVDPATVAAGGASSGQCERVSHAG